MAMSSWNVTILHTCINSKCRSISRFLHFCVDINSKCRYFYLSTFCFNKACFPVSRLTYIYMSDKCVNRHPHPLPQPQGAHISLLIRETRQPWTCILAAKTKHNLAAQTKKCLRTGTKCTSSDHPAQWHWRLSQMYVRLVIRRSRVRSTQGPASFFLEINHEIFSTAICSLPLIQEGQLSVSGERLCIKYWVTAYKTKSD